MRGRALLAPGELLPRDLVAELHADPEIEDHIRPRTHRFALSHWPWKAIVDRDGTRHVYRSDRDADEATPLAPGALPAALDSTARSLAEQLGEFESGDVPPGEVEELDPQTRNGLRALGYAE